MRQVGGGRELLVGCLGLGWCTGYLLHDLCAGTGHQAWLCLAPSLSPWVSRLPQGPPVIITTATLPQPSPQLPQPPPLAPTTCPHPLPLPACRSMCWLRISRQQTSRWG